MRASRGGQLRLRAAAMTTPPRPSAPEMRLTPLPPCRPLHPPPPHRSYKRNNALFGDAPPDALVRTFAQQRAAGTNARRHQAPPIPPAAKKRGARALELFKAQTGAEGWRGMRSKA